MPISEKYKKVLESMIKEYGKEKGTSVFYATMKKKGIDYSKEQETFCKISFKEDEGEYYTCGYIATDHIDSVGDMILPATLYSWANSLNNDTDFKSKPLSIHHNRSDKNLAGIGTKAKVEKLSDGHYGLWVETHHNKEHPDFNKTKYEIDNNFLTHYSIEYNTFDDTTTHRENVGNEWIRVIEPNTELLGYGLASPRTVVNENATITEEGYKELFHVQASQEEVKIKEVKEVKPMETKQEVKEKVEEKVEVKEVKPVQKETKSEVKEKVDIEMKEMIREEIKSRLEKTEPINKPSIENKEKIEKPKIQFKELEDYKEAVIDKKVSLKEQWQSAARLHNSLVSKGVRFTGEVKEIPFELSGNKIEMKAGSAVTTDTDYAGAQTSMMLALSNYEQTPSRYNDIYGPVIVNQLNDMTTTWNLLTKENMTGMSAIRFRARTARNATAGHYAYGSTPGWDSNTTIKKFNLHFITSYVEVAVEFEAMELANVPGGIGDVYAREIEYGTLDLMTYLNGSNGIFGTGDGTSESAPLGLDGGCIITSGNLYGKDVTATGYTTLAAGAVTNMSSANITLKKMRELIRTSVTNGARIEDLVFVCSYLQKDFIVALIQDIQRIVPTSARVGFTGMPELDGVPLFADKDLDAASMTDDLFLIDTSVTKIGIKKAPTYQEFSLVALERRGIIWMMWNLFCEAPNHNCHIYGLATS